MRGGIVLFRGSGRAARHYLESDHSRADDYYLESGGAVARRHVSTANGEVRDVLDAEAYAKWVDWSDPATGEVRGKPRTAMKVESKDGRIHEYPASPMFAEMTINVPKSLSLAAESDPRVSAALDAAEERAADALHEYLRTHTGTRVGPRGAQRAVLAEKMETVTVSHRTSRAGDPHRHLHFQVSTRLFAEQKWRALDTDVMFRQQGVLRSIGESVINTDSELQDALAQAGFEFDTTTGEVVELEPYDSAMSKRAAQVERTLDHLTQQWREDHSGQEPGPEARSFLHQAAWAQGRPEKRTGIFPTTEQWRAELDALGYRPPTGTGRPVHIHTLDAKERAILADDILAELASQRSTWSPADVEGMAYSHLLSGRFGTCVDQATLPIQAGLLTELAMNNCLLLAPSVWSQTARATAARVWTTQDVIDADVDMRTRLLTRAEGIGTTVNMETVIAAEIRADLTLDPSQRAGVSAVVSTDHLVVIEGAAGAGKTTMLKVANAIMEDTGRAMRVVTPTLKAAQAATREAGVRGDSLAKLLHANGYRWDKLGRWNREAVEVPEAFTLTRGETIIVDEAGMVDVETARALLTLADESGARLVMVGDRAQLPAVGRGGVLDAAYDAARNRVELTDLHRFREDGYGELSLRLRHRDAAAIDDLIASDHVAIHAQIDDALDAYAHRVALDLAGGIEAVVVVATNEEAVGLSGRVRQEMIALGAIDGASLLALSDQNEAGIGDLIQIRQNDRELGLSNRQLLVIDRTDWKGNVVLTSPGASTNEVHVPREWLAEHATLGYALTAHGVQGETVDHAYVLATDRMDGAALYVGLTRGRYANEVAVVAADSDHAVTVLQDMLDKDSADRGVMQSASKNVERMTAMYENDATNSRTDELRLHELTELRNALYKDVQTRSRNIHLASSTLPMLDQLKSLDAQVTACWTERGETEPGREKIATSMAKTEQRIRGLVASAGGHFQADRAAIRPNERPRL